MEKSNVVLIGMPSSGKSTIGKGLAEKLGMGFIDTDTVIMEKYNKPLREIVKEDGLGKFLEIQEKTILEIRVTKHVIATGGGVIYGDASMRHLQAMGTVVFLQSDFSEIENRLEAGRRFARPEGQSLQELYNERLPLYRKYADTTIDCTGKSVEEIMKDILCKCEFGIHT